MAKDWQLYALHILDCIKKIREIQTRGDILVDAVLYDATLRNLQTLSESTMHLPVDFKVAHQHINWKGINGFRNILVHDYLGDIEPAVVVVVINDYLPELERVIINLVKDI